MVWSEIEPMPCDVTDCPNDARWAYIGESGDVYLCADHYTPEINPEAARTSRQPDHRLITTLEGDPEDA